MIEGDPIEAAFGPIRGLPCWNVRPGQGSFLTLEFGQPHLEIRQPREATHTQSARIKRHYARRRINVCGEWHLWIYCCAWNFFLREALVGDSGSEKGIQETVRELDGQSLVSVKANDPMGHSVFEFDLGGRLITRPFEEPDEEPSDQWMLFEPSGQVLTFRADGMYSHQHKTTPPRQERWHPLPVPPAV